MSVTPPDAPVQVQFTIDDAPARDAIVADLLHERLIACAQTLGPITSSYWWHGAIERAEEWMVVCKTTSDHVPAIVERIRARHPYAVPEIVATVIGAGFAGYLDWIVAETQPRSAARS